MNAHRYRHIDGLLLLNKPSGMTSNAALQHMRRLLAAKKGGHAGSLDPLATGVLPLLFGEATKTAAFLLHTDKSYEATIRLGEATTTGDSDGVCNKTLPVPKHSDDAVKRVLQQFCGTIQQIPPMYSALKQNGVPLYTLARKGKTVARPARTVHIDALHLQKRSGTDGNALHLTVDCSKGTYIRTLAEDIGNALGTCAHITALHRTRVGTFHIADCIDIDTCSSTITPETLLRPICDCLPELPRVILCEQTTHAVRQGQSVPLASQMQSQYNENDSVLLYSFEQICIGIGIIRDGNIAPKRLLNVHSRTDMPQQQHRT